MVNLGFKVRLFSRRRPCACAGTDISRGFNGSPVRLCDRPARKQGSDQGSGEGIASAYGIDDFNHTLSKAHYFETEIKRDGIILFDSGTYKLARRKKLNFKEIKERAQKYYNDKFGRAKQFLKGVTFYCEDGDYNMASFHLHQSAENFLRTIPITFILYGHKSHDLSELMNAAKKHTPEIFKAFPRDTPEEKRLFDLLQRAYIESRYNPDFEITKADIDALLPKIELLRDVVEQVCNERLAYYDSRIEK